jgi:hypothetical protein
MPHSIIFYPVNTAILGISPQAVKTRLLRRGIKPKQQAGRLNFYDESVVDRIREVSKGGRPRKEKRWQNP